MRDDDPFWPSNKVFSEGLSQAVVPLEAPCAGREGDILLRRASRRTCGYEAFPDEFPLSAYPLVPPLHPPAAILHL